MGGLDLAGSDRRLDDDDPDRSTRRLDRLSYAGAGPAVVLAYGLAIIGIIPVMLAKAELATAMPRWLPMCGVAVGLIPLSARLVR